MAHLSFLALLLTGKVRGNRETQEKSGKLKKIERNSGKVRKRMEGQGISGKLRETHVKSGKIYVQIAFFAI